VHSLVIVVLYKLTKLVLQLPGLCGVRAFETQSRVLLMDTPGLS
jgi:hypothetical protein